MADPRVEKLADILVNHSIKVKKGERIVVNYQSEAYPLALELYKLILKKGAYPIMHCGMPGFTYAYFKYASKQQLKKFPELTMYEAKHTDAEIDIGATYNSRELTNIHPQKIALRRKVTQPIADYIHKRGRWVLVEYPTNALAQDAEMSLDEMEDFVFNATNIDWKKVEKKGGKLKKIIDKGKEVRIIGNETDIRFSIEGRKGENSPGIHNMPDGEVFTSPVENSTYGHIHFEFPAVYGGKEVEGVKLAFRKGEVVHAEARKNEDYLKHMIRIDKGAKRLGEFGIGINYGIKKFTKRILFDEKIGGTIHLALGNSFPECGGKNKSALHWDMIKDLRKEGRVYVDGKLIIKDGKILV
ncbi:MAG: aminopeptidase [Candidatus Nanoarchaeia archaeon]